MFFNEKTKNFFKPLNGKYRECTLRCIVALYQALYASLATSSQQLSRQQVLEIFSESLMNAPLLDGDDDFAGESNQRSEQERAKHVLSKLLEHAWLEHHYDDTSMQSAYRFTKWGRALAQALRGKDAGQFRTKHRNTRNTKNALQSFVTHGEIYDLLDAWEYSERIISDFSDLVTELEDRKRSLIQSVESDLIKRQATQEFFDYMDKRFTPDVAVRLSADNIERHKDDILNLLRAVRNKRKNFKAEAELKLREVLPQFIDDRSESLLIKILTSIELRVKNASETMIPEVRRSLRDYTNRADVIIRQLTYVSSQRQADINQVFEGLVDLPAEEQDARLLEAAKHFETINLNFIDPQHLRLREIKKRRRLNNQLTQTVAMDKETRKATFVKDALEKAFMIRGEEQSAYLTRQLSKGKKVNVVDLSVESANDFLSLTHALEAIISLNNQSNEFSIKVTWHIDEAGSIDGLIQRKEVVNTDFLERTDNYSLELVEHKH